MALLQSIVGFALAAFVVALPANQVGVQGISFQNGVASEPLLSLDYATYKGTYNNNTDIYTFKNIRFAAPPIGKLRWRKPAPPLKMTEIQNGLDTHICTQYMPSRSNNDMEAKDNEDCLFLDVTVPGAAIRNTTVRFPVLDWVYGGAYIAGSKEMPGAPETMVSHGNNSFIWVAGNYRLGAYGFLAGKTVEQEGVPNAGLWDQRAVLEWIQKYIHLVGGDKSQVTAMGISAGAGSIQHHLIAEGGTLDPLFSKVILQSPGYMNLQDRHGQIETNYKQFEEFAGCAGKGLDCLRELNPVSLKIAADKSNALSKPGSFTFGPTPDGKYIANTPTIEFTNGRFWKGIKKVISSHVTDEGSMFVDRTFVTDSTFDNMLDAQLSNTTQAATLRLRAKRMYPPINHLNSPYKFEQDRIASSITESTFTCHNRLVSDAYPGLVYSVDYSVAPATHGSDQSATFFSPYGAIFRGIPPEAIGERMAYQSYFLSFIRTGDPNTYRNNETIAWPLTTGFNETTLGNTLKFTYPIGPGGFAIVNDEELVKARCGFWAEVQTTVADMLNETETK